MCMAIAMSDTTRPDNNVGYGIGTGAESGIMISIGVRSDVDKPKVVEDKVDITTLDKINKISILVSY